MVLHVVETNGATIAIAMVAVVRDPMIGTAVRDPMIDVKDTTIMIMVIAMTDTTIMIMIMVIDVTDTTIMIMIMIMVIAMTDTTITVAMIAVPTTIDREEAGAAAPAERDMGGGPGVEIQDRGRTKGAMVVVSMNLEGAGGDRLPSREIGANADGAIMGGMVRRDGRELIGEDTCIDERIVLVTLLRTQNTSVL